MTSTNHLDRRHLLLAGAAFAISACRPGSPPPRSGNRAPSTPSTTQTPGVPMSLTVSQCFIAVHDHDQALAFYRDTLGLEVKKDVKYEGMRWTTLGSKAQPDVEIVLEPPLADPSAPEVERKAMAELLAKGRLRAVIFATASCDQTFAHVRASGAKVLQEPTDQFWGVRDCAFADPSGNEIRFAQKG